VSCAPDTTNIAVLCQECRPLLHSTCFRALPPVKKKRNLFPGAQPSVSRGLRVATSFVLLRTHAAGAGTLTRFPFGGTLFTESILSHSLPAPPLGPPHPCPYAVHTEPSSTSVFNQNSQLNICYFHQICTKGCSMPAYADTFMPSPLREPSRLGTLSHLSMQQAEYRSQRLSAIHFQGYESIGRIL